MNQMINKGLYRTRDGSFIMFRWRRTKRNGKPFAELINIVTGDNWFMSMSKARTQRYLANLTYLNCRVKCRLGTYQNYYAAMHPDFKRGGA